VKSSVNLSVCIIAAVLLMTASSVVPLSAGRYLSIDKADVSGFPDVAVSLKINGSDHTVSDEEISLYENGYPVEKFSLTKENNSDDLLYLVFSLDASRSIKSDFLKKIKLRAVELIDATSGSEKVALYRFNDKVILLNDFSSQRAELIKNIDSVTREGSKTLLYNAVYDGIDQLQRASGSRKGIVVFTDGRDEGSSLSADDVIEFAREAGIAVHFITGKTIKSSEPVFRIARLTGGSVMYAEEKGTAERMHQIVSSAGPAQYLLKYRSACKAEGQGINLEVRLRSGVIRDRAAGQYTLPRDKGFSFPVLSNAAVIVISVVLLVLVLAVLLIFFRKKLILPAGEKTAVFDNPDICSAPAARRPVDLNDFMEETEKTLTPDDDGYSYCRAWLMEKDGPETGKKFPIYWDEVSSGRGRQNSIVVLDPAISPEHARIRLVKNSYYLFDLASENGTFLNGKKLLRPKPIHDWDEIMLGRTLFVFRGIKA